MNLIENGKQIFKLQNKSLAIYNQPPNHLATNMQIKHNKHVLSK